MPGQRYAKLARPFCKLLLRHAMKLSGMDDKTVRGRPHKIKWEARDECKIVAGRRRQDSNVGGSNDFCRFDAILEAAACCLKSDFVTPSNVAEWPEESIAVTSQNDIPPLTGQGRLWQMTCRMP